ncbi:MAG: TetR/AcrR family transcriptional regulator [Myxococcales bacterium]|nr:TetR/AcrR family transcriptional regulator [Polyangiaceae bacterium]MDW8250858.1 TetR/AcrR family transcriptional regulator [Myxococcales bacterium]
MPLPRFQGLEEERRRAILGAAAEEFGERGFTGASYNRIIERLGLSKGAMYYYFANKDDLFETVLETALSEWFRHVGLPASSEDAASFWASCEETYEKSLRFMLSDRINGALCLAITRARERLDGHPALLELNRRMREWTTTLVRHGREVGAIRNDVPEALMVEAAMALMDAADRWLASCWSELSEENAGEIARSMMDLFRGIATKPPALTKTNP